MVALEHVTKAFAAVVALSDVGLTVGRGEIHALVGENGSGKSTLVKVLAGVCQPDAGSVVVNGERHAGLQYPGAAAALGVRVVHQESPLVDTLTVAECVSLFHRYPTSRLRRVQWREVRRRARTLLDQLEIPVDPGALASTLAPAERAMVSLAIALGGAGDDASVLVLDEATAALPERDAETFLTRVVALARNGLPVLMVSHRLGEVALADRVTVLRAGEVVHQGPASLSAEELVAKMIGDDRPEVKVDDRAGKAGAVAGLWSARKTSSRLVSDAPALVTEHLSGGRLEDISLTVGRGEIVGIAGLRDSGIDDLPMMLTGALRRRSGVLRVAGADLPRSLSPRKAREAGVALVPADRMREGGVQSLSVAENVVLPEAPRYWHRPSREREVVRAVIRELDVRPPQPSAVLGTLSGGNQQKVVIGKWLLLRPSLLVLDDPTYGVDPGARRSIMALVAEAAAEGVGVLLLSTEPEQLVDACARVIILRGGRVAHEIGGARLDLQTLTELAWA